MKKSTSKWMVLTTVILMDLLSGTELDLFVPSFPEMQSQFDLTPFWVEALLSSNFIGYCLSLFFVGGLADHYGRRPIILTGLGIFILGSVLCLWEASYYIILFGRFLQGVGVAAPAILSFLIIADSYPLSKQQFYMAMLNGVMCISVAIAPVVGSYITLYFHWQGNFIALLILGLFTLIMTLLFIPKGPKSEHKRSLTLKGYIPLFKSKPLMLLIVNVAFIFVPWWIFVGVAPLLFMQDLGVSLVNFGYYQGGPCLAFAIGSIIYGFVMHRFDQKKMLQLNNLIFIFSLGTLSLAAGFNSTDPLLITLAFFPFVIGQIIPSVIIYPLSLNYIPDAKGRISALIQAARLILSAIGLQIAGYYYGGTFQNIAIILIVFIFIALISTYLVLNKMELK